MLSQTIQNLVIGGVIGSVVGFLVSIPYLKKKGIDVNKGIETVEDALKSAAPIINLTSNLMPNNPGVNILKSVQEWGSIATGYAEQLCHADDINKDERGAKAEEVVQAALKELGIDIDDNRKLLVDAAIKDMVNKLGHKDKTEAEKEVEKQTLQNQLERITQERDALKNTIDTITTAANTVQLTTQANVVQSDQDSVTQNVIA